VYCVVLTAGDKSRDGHLMPYMVTRVGGRYNDTIDAGECKPLPPDVTIRTR